jgi:hypothetical protein
MINGLPRTLIVRPIVRWSLDLFYFSEKFPRLLFTRRTECSSKENVAMKKHRTSNAPSPDGWEEHPIGSDEHVMNLAARNMRHKICQCCGEAISVRNLLNQNICMGCEHPPIEETATRLARSALPFESADNVPIDSLAVSTHGSK